jgi:hypothetical protein
MIKISDIRPSNLPVSVEIDPYVPLAVRTFTAPIGAVFFRVGNFDTSLVEVPIDPISGLIRGIKLVSIDRVGFGVADGHLPAVEGLPVVASESVPTKRQDEKQEVTVSLMGNRFYLDWSNGRQIESKATHGRMTFFIGSEVLLGASIEDITESEAQQLRKHLVTVTPSSSS